MSLACRASITKRVMTPSSRMMTDEPHSMLNSMFCTCGAHPQDSAA
jgi:hypothetical protein